MEGFFSQQSSQPTPQQSTSQQPSKSKEKRRIPNYDLDENLYKEYDYKLSSGSQKRIKLDTKEGQEDALNVRSSFVKLVSSASLLLPPEVESVIITRDTYTVEWDQTDGNKIPPTKAVQIIQEVDKELIQEEIHRSSFQIPFLFSNNLTTAEMRNKAAGEHRTVVTSYVTDTDNSLTANQMDAVALISRKQLKDAAANKRENEKLNRYINMVNDVLYFFVDINPRNVPIRDKKLVSIYF